MKPDGPAIAAARWRAGLTYSQVAGRMRRAGLRGTTAHWVSMVERGLFDDVDGGWLETLAATLGVERRAITRRHLRVVE
jgi:hypothetical protein